jgi:hypothetical protein
MAAGNRELRGAPDELSLVFQFGQAIRPDWIRPVGAAGIDDFDGGISPLLYLYIYSDNIINIQQTS